MKALTLTAQDATREKLLALARQVPGARVGIKAAALLLVLAGWRPAQVTAPLGLSHVTVERWIRAVNQDGPETLIPKARAGRPTQLTPVVRQQLAQHLEKSPQEFGLPRPAWDGPTLAIHLKQHFGVTLKVRQAQRWMHRLGYSLKRASYAYIQAHAEDARKFGRELKKTEKS